MEIKLSDGQMMELVKEAIFRGLPEEKRDYLLKSAIEHLLKPTSASYNSPTTIQTIYINTLNEVCRELITAELKKDTGLRAKLTTAVQLGLNKVFEEKSEELAGHFASAISDAFKVNTNY